MPVALVPETFEPGDHPHRRFNPLTGTHVLVSPHRMRRPWNGQTEDPVRNVLPPYDPTCSLCPGNERTGGVVNPAYTDTFAFPNDYPAVLPGPLPTLPPDAPPPLSSAAAATSVDALFASEPVRGRCSVMCFHRRHDVTLARMAVSEITAVVRRWRKVYEAEKAFLRQDGGGGYVQIFENRGAMMGASAPHPHGQIWTVSYIPDEVATELANLEAHAKARPFDPAPPASELDTNTASAKVSPEPRRADGTPCLLCTYAHAEVLRGERVVALDEDGGWVALVPFWALWPFETLVLPYRRHVTSLSDLSEAEEEGLARVLKALLVRYDNLFSASFPYSMGLHQAPVRARPTRAHQSGDGVGSQAREASEAPAESVEDAEGETATDGAAVQEAEDGEEEDDANADAGCAAHLHIHFYPPLLRSAGVRKFLVGFEMLCEAQRDLTPEAAAARLRAAGGVHYLDQGESADTV